MKEYLENNSFFNQWQTPRCIRSVRAFCSVRHTPVTGFNTFNN